MITLELHVPTFKLGAIDIAAIKLHSEENDSKDLLLQSSLSISSAEPLQYVQCFKSSPSLANAGLEDISQFELL